MPIRPRVVHRSVELGSSPAATRHAAALAAVAVEITTGQDLRSRLSDRVSVAYTPTTARTALRRRKDLDLLLADWGIHHLHLSSKSDGVRTADLLFAVFRPDDAYLLQVLPHGSWTDESLLEIIVGNWPNAGLLLGSVSGARLAQPITPEDRRQLRRAGGSSFIEIDGTLYMPRSQTVAGTPLDGTQRSNVIMHELRRQRIMHELRRQRIMHELRRQRILLVEGPAALDAQVMATECPVNGPGDWRPYVDDRQMGFVNEVTGVLLPLGVLGGSW